MVIEIVQVLSSRVLYNLPRDQIRVHVTNLLRLRGFKLLHKRVYLRALEVYATYPGLDFVDALNVAHVERMKLGRIISFDRDFDRIPDIKRIEP